MKILCAMAASNCAAGCWSDRIVPRRQAVRRSRISCSLPQQQFEVSILGDFQMSKRTKLDPKAREHAKMNLLRAVVETNRGYRTTQEQRALVEEAMVEVESYNAGSSLRLEELDGTWLLRYTSAPDVVSILEAETFPLFKAGQIYQKFQCKDHSDGGTVVNVVRWSIPGVLQEDEGATLFVTAGFTIVTSRTIQLEFKEARLGNILLSEDFQALLAPAFLPRTFFNLMILQYLKSFEITVPLLSSPANARRRQIGLLYNLTYLDNNMLIGRALGSGGAFVFGRTQPL